MFPARRIAVWLGLLALSPLAARCGRDRADAAPAAVRVTDDAGRTVALPHAARRVVALIPSVNETILALGAGDRLVARTDYDREPELARLPSVGGGLTPSIEWLVARHPDLVVAWPDRGSRAVVARLAEAGVPVYVARVEGVEDGFRTAANLGRLLGISRRADSLVAALRRDIDRVRAAVAARPAPSVLYLIGTDPPMAAAEGTAGTDLLAIANGRNAFADARVAAQQVSVEEVIRRNPDVVLVAQYEAGDPVGRLRSRPGWRSLPAVRNGRVFALDPDLFNRPGPRIAEAARRLAALLHPDVVVP
ncbi:MAG: ABC transporter substrate-binding protein [Gemmatimonadetes bacterium]|nr:ABC transporter substrate-binding protein [Gemmatimonadota bacterium]